MLATALCNTARVGWGDNMRREREARGWTRVEAAQRIGAVEGTIRSLEESETMPVRSKHARTLMEIYELGDDAVEATNPRLLDATALQLARRLADLIAEQEGDPPRHDQTNVSAGHESWRSMPLRGDSERGAQA